MGILIEAFKAMIEIFYRISGDYGVSILLITVSVRIILLPLNIIQRKQMKKQQSLQKMAEQIKQRYEKNEKRMKDELQKLYESESAGGLGCILPFLQFPVMILLYRAILSVVTVGTGTILLPWIDSLLSRDTTWLLPIATLLIQLLPQLYPYIPYFESLQMPKQQFSMLLPMIVMNAVFVFAIPSGVGLYYFISGLFTAVEQFTGNCMEVKRLKIS